MTREEAIQEFQNVKDLVKQDGKDWFDERDLELIDMAIEALSADTVSRKDTVTLNSPISIQAEMVAVVRCKDCKYSFYDKDYESYNCRKHEYVECFDADDYCSWGERND